jgi:hypothetical protein
MLLPDRLALLDGQSIQLVPRKSRFALRHALLPAKFVRSVCNRQFVPAHGTGTALRQPLLNTERVKNVRARQAHDLTTHWMTFVTDAALAVDGVDEVFRVYRDNGQGAERLGRGGWTSRERYLSSCACVTGIAGSFVVGGPAQGRFGRASNRFRVKAIGTGSCCRSRSGGGHTCRHGGAETSRSFSQSSQELFERIVEIVVIIGIGISGACVGSIGIGGIGGVGSEVVGGSIAIGSSIRRGIGGSGGVVVVVAFVVVVYAFVSAASSTSVTKGASEDVSKVRHDDSVVRKELTRSALSVVL